MSKIRSDDLSTADAAIIPSVESTREWSEAITERFTKAYKALRTPDHSSAAEQRRTAILDAALTQATHEIRRLAEEARSTEAPSGESAKQPKHTTGERVLLSDAIAAAIVAALRISREEVSEGMRDTPPGSSGRSGSVSQDEREIPAAVKAAIEAVDDVFDLEIVPRTIRVDLEGEGPVLLDLTITEELPERDPARTSDGSD